MARRPPEYETGRRQLDLVQSTPQGPHENSYAAWLRVKDALTPKRQALFDALFELPGHQGTHNQVADGLSDGEWQTSSNNVSKLLGEMARMDLVERAGTVKCPVSGFEATLWRLTGRPACPVVARNKTPRDKGARLADKLKALLFKVAAHLEGKGLVYEADLIRQRVAELEANP